MRSLRLAPAGPEPRPAYSFSTYVNTNNARIGFAYAVNVSPPQNKEGARVWNGKFYEVPSDPSRGNGAFLYAAPGSKEVELFDFVRLRPRKGGFKAHFLK